MQVLFVNGYGNTEVRELQNVPQKGDRVSMFYKPFPIVQDVLWLPNRDTLSDLHVGGGHIEVIVYVR